MPLVANFSREFYERFGHKAVEELVNYLNAADATHRSEFRELIDLHFAKLDATLAQRTGALENRLESRIETGLGTVRDLISAARADMIKWMFVFMVTGVLAVLGLG
ncbi:MAG: hypothetical protein WD043_11155 [Gemmatimonadales bacterium]